MKSNTKFKMPTSEQIRDFKRNLEGRYQLFLVLFKWDRIYRREVLVTLLAFFLINYSIFDLDNPFDWVALIVEAIIIWVQVGNEFSILPKEYRPHQNGISFGATPVKSITHDRQTVGFNEILPPKAEDKLKMYNPDKNRKHHAETALCSDILNDHLMTVKHIPYRVIDRPENYISSVHQIRYLAIRVANKKQHTTNRDKLCLDATAQSLMDKNPVPVRKASYFDALLTAEAFRSRIVCENLRGMAEVNTDLTQYYPVDEITGKKQKQLRLSDDYYKRVSGHIGATSLLITENNRVLMLFQGANKAMEANKIHLGGSGSMDFEDAKMRSDEDLRDAIRRCMARESAEETGMMSHYNDVYANTMITGFFHWMDRSAKPEFTGLTRAGNVPFAAACELDGDEIVKAEEIPVTITKMSDFKKVWDYAMKHKLNLSLSSFVALHRMTVIAKYNGAKATKKQKQIYKDVQTFLFA